jgi:hypothetical protein
MARIRSIKPEIWMSPQVMNLSHGARLLFIGLITQSDDEGRGTADPRRVKASIFGGDDVTSEQVRQWLEECTKQRLATVYETESHGALYQLPTWKQHQSIDRPKKSTYPGPSDRRAVDDPSSNDRRTIDDASRDHARGSEGSEGSERSSRAAVDNSSGGGGAGRLGAPPPLKRFSDSLSPSPPQDANGHDKRSFQTIKDSVASIAEKFATSDPDRIYSLGHASMKLSRKQCRVAVQQLREDGFFEQMQKAAGA